jgi:hypothetical protein
MASTSSRRAWPAQAPEGHGQHKLQKSTTSTSSRLAWPEPARDGLSQHGASFRRVEQHAWRAWGKLQEGSKLQLDTARCRGREGAEKHLHSTLEIPLWHGEPEEDADDTLTQQPTHQAQAPPWTRPSNSRVSSRSPWPQSRASEAKGDAGNEDAIEWISRAGGTAVA